MATIATKVRGGSAFQAMSRTRRIRREGVGGAPAGLSPRTGQARLRRSGCSWSSTFLPSSARRRSAALPPSLEASRLHPARRLPDTFRIKQCIRFINDKRRSGHHLVKVPETEIHQSVRLQRDAGSVEPSCGSVRRGERADRACCPNSARKTHGLRPERGGRPSGEALSIPRA